MVTIALFACVTILIGFNIFLDRESFIYRILYVFTPTTALKIMQGISFTEFRCDHVSVIGFLSGINILAISIAPFLNLNYLRKDLADRSLSIP